MSLTLSISSVPSLGREKRFSVNPDWFTPRLISVLCNNDPCVTEDVQAFENVEAHL